MKTGESSKPPRSGTDMSSSHLHPSKPAFRGYKNIVGGNSNHSRLTQNMDTEKEMVAEVPTANIRTISIEEQNRYR